MKVRQFFSFFLVLVLVVGVLTVPAMAAEISSYDLVFSDGVWMGYGPALEHGVDYNFDLYFSADGVAYSYFYSYAGSFGPFEGDASVLYCNLGNSIQLLMSAVPGVDDYMLGLVNGGTVSFPDLSYCRIVVSGDSSDYYNDTLTNTFNSVIFWVGAIFNSLLGGSLSGLGGIFAIGISVSALFFAIKSIYSLIWGS